MWTGTRGLVCVRCRCGWRRGQLSQMLEMHAHGKGDPSSYNEVVIDLQAYERGLPSSVDAFFYTVYATEAQRKVVRDAHAGFVHAYGRRTVAPLLLYDPGKARSGAPFTLVE